MILLHYTVYESLDKTIHHFQRSTSHVSAHYIIGKDGGVVRMVRDEDEAFHAGKSYWKGENSCNRFSIGIEIVNEGKKRKIIPYTLDQVESLITLCKRLIRNYSIPPERILGHSDVAIPIGRKKDPGPHFDWEYLAHKGIGRMPEHPRYQDFVMTSKSLKIGMKGIEVRRLQRGLKRIGYQIPVNGIFDKTTRNIVKTFQLHFRRHLISGIADPDTLLRIRNLNEKLPISIVK